ncbi:MAG: acetyl-CoA C-acetyltransferase [Actinomycetota bacterium]|jgi:acetyl-CoA C-acetyltransferase
MPLDPRTPVIVGVGQTLRRLDTAAEATEPVDMMVDALRVAADDAGVGAALLERADSVRVIEVLSWRYANPGLLVAERVGASPRQLVKSTTGGNSPQMVLNDAAAAIQQGDLDVVLIAGAEAMRTRFLARKTKEWLEWTAQPAETPAPVVLGNDGAGTNDVEMARAMALPTQVYPIFENALRVAAGESVDEHQEKVARLWAAFSEVGARNPHAWTPTARSAEEIRTVTADNRMIGFPYPKYMNSNLQTDQAAAVVLCSVEAARALGIPEERWVFPWAGADAHDHWWVSERADLHSSPAIGASGRTVFEMAGRDVDDVAHVDVYSCFPSAVQIGAAELGLSLDRQLTVTGGLCFAGGPGNNYVTHSIASMADTLRADPGSLGLVTALGWYVTKHSIGLYSTEPPAGPYRRASPQAEVDALPRRGYTGDYDGPVTVESFTVMHERDGSPSLGIVACLLPDGQRAWGNVREEGALKSLLADDPIGAKGQLRKDGTLELS